MSSEKQKQTPDKTAAYARMAGYCSRAEHCSSRVRRKLSTLLDNESDREEIIERLIQEDFINDSRYASTYAHDKFHFYGRGPVRIARELRANGIPPDIIAKALAELRPDDDGDSVESKLCEMIQRDWSKRNPEEDSRKIEARIIRRMIYRGFSFAQICSAMKTVKQENE